MKHARFRTTNQYSKSKPKPKIYILFFVTENISKCATNIVFLNGVDRKNSCIILTDFGME